MLEQSEVPLKQKPNNMLGTGDKKNESNYNQKLKKIKFDRGIPMSFDLVKNEVKTFDYKLQNILLIIFRKVIFRPLQILLLLLLVIYGLIHLIKPNLHFIENIDYIIYIHLSLLGMELIIECVKLYKIYLNDYLTNSQSANIYDPEHRTFIIAKWSDIRVGHIIKVSKNEIVPADLILLETMDSSHLCYVDVSAITGIFDKFLIKKACSDTQTPTIKSIKFSEYVKNVKGMLKFEDQDNNINSFTGRLKLESFPRATDITDENFLMRGSTVKNVKWVYGLVVYTGMETKIMRIFKFQTKSSTFGINKENRNLLFKSLLFTQYFLIIFYLVLLLILTLSHINKSYMIENSISKGFNLNIQIQLIKPWEEFVLSFSQFIFTFLLIIPYNWFSFLLIGYYIISLFVTWDIKILQKSKYTVDVINSDCLSDFGQVKYILADKTGTLTSRKYNLKACSIKGKIFSFESQDSSEEANIFKNKNNNYSDLEIYQELKKNTVVSKYIREFFEFLCLCNTIKLTANDKKDTNNINNHIDPPNANSNNYFNSHNNFQTNKDNTNEKVYGASFAEDISLMKVLKFFGYSILKTKTDKTEIESDNLIKNFSIVGRNKFSQERQRMSIIVKKSKNDSESILICKGYDLSIFELINDHEESQLKLVIEQIKRLSLIGYRYIIVCKKELSEDETNIFLTRYKSAENYIFQREIHFEELAEDYETDMELLGVLFFEEKISPDLRYTINKLNNYNINTWIVSGDNKENVLAVGRNLDMYKPNALVCEFSEFDDEDDLDIKMNLFLSQFYSSGEVNNNVTMKTMNTRKGLKINVDTSANKIKSKGKEFTILIHGECFNIICNDIRLYQCFTALLSYTTSLFAYSFSPHNKYLLCKTVKNFLTKISNSKVLAVGDGLNDFMMLKEADLSIGIRSKEILQVRNTCDIIVSRFSQITDLILIHGTWNFNRIIKIIFFSAYSNILIIFPFFLHQNTNLEGSSFLEINYLKLNLDLLLINITIVILFCLNTNIERSLIGLNQNIYFENFDQNNRIYLDFAKIIVISLVDSSLIYFLSCEMLRYSINLIGQHIDDSTLSYFINYACYILIIIKLFFIELAIINSYIFLCLLFIIGGLISFTFIDENVVISIFQSLSHLSILLSMICIIAFCFLYEGFFVYIKEILNPSFVQIINKKFKKYIEDYILFIKFDDILREINFLNSNRSRNQKNNVIFKDVLQSIHDKYKGIDPVLDNRKNLKIKILVIDINNDELVKMKIDKIYLKFSDDVTETDYKIEHSNLLHNTFIFYIITELIFWIVDVAIEISEKNLDKDKISKILKIILITTGFIFYWKPFRINFSNFFKYYYYINIFMDIILLYVDKGNNNIKLCFLNIASLTYPLTISSFDFYYIICGVFVYLVGSIPVIFIDIQNFVGLIHLNDNSLFENNISYLPLLYHKLLFIVGNIFLMLLFGYHEEFFTRINFLKYYKKSNDMRKNNEIYSNLVPEFVREKMKNGIRGAAIDFEIVTILFCDISDFDRFVASMSPKDLIQLLDRIYNTFDQLCTLHGLQKIETVGKTYMATAGLKECEKDVDPILLRKHQSIRTFELSLDMIDTIEKIILENGETVKIKIGVHTGKVIAAVVGNHKPQFSLIGDAINTTARMCAYSSDMCVLCSEPCWENINKEYQDFQKSFKEVKGKGQMNIYLYNPRKPKANIPENKAKLKLGETKMLSNFNMNFNNPRKNMVRKQTISKESYLNNNNNRRKALQRQNSAYSNQSNFIFENSIDGPDELKNNIDKSNKPKPKTLSRLVTHKEVDNLQEKNAEGFDKNYIWNKSFLFLKFYEQNSYDLFNDFSKYKFSKSTDRATFFNYAYSIIMLVGIFNMAEYSLIEQDFYFVFIIIKTLLILILLFFSHMSSSIIQYYNRPGLIQAIIWFIYLCLTILIQVQINYVINELFCLNLCLEQNLTTLVVSFNGFLHYQVLFYNFILYIVIFSINASINNHSIAIIKYNVFNIVICIIIFIFLVIRYYISTLDYLKNLSESENLKKIENLLYNLMPQHVVLNLKEDIPVADVLEEVTMLFAEREPVEVVRMLSELFKQCDDSCKNLNCYKVHTIGDCYVVMSFTGRTPLNERNFKEEAKNVVKMGESMIEIIKKVRESVNFNQLNMRIGIHTGTVIAGIVGTKVVRYDIFGSDVLIANKMESNGETGRISVSEDTKNLLEYEDGVNKDSFYKFIPNKTVHVSSVNREIKSYFISENPDN